MRAFRLLQKQNASVLPFTLLQSFYGINPWRITPVALIIQTIPEEEPVFGFDSGEVGPETGRDLPVVLLVDQHCGHYLPGALLAAEVGYGGQSNPFIQDIIQ